MSIPLHLQVLHIPYPSPGNLRGRRVLRQGGNAAKGRSYEMFDLTAEALV
jgi:hypothetical protein